MASGTGDPNWIPDLLHLNDWTSALAPAYLAWSGRSIPSVLTIHNLAHRGLFAPCRRWSNQARPDAALAHDRQRRPHRAPGPRARSRVQRPHR
ncbi:glycogen/starch synthase [Salmonella enterica]|uniref:glycogen/starch synthase n=1 Tax=Salmonella enterica TaxID=28901 RepID=UPI0035BE4F17